MTCPCLRSLLIMLLPLCLQGQLVTRVILNGGPYTDSFGNLWSTDTGCSGATPYASTSAITGTPDQTLFQTGEYGSGPIACTYSVSQAWFYYVTLNFSNTQGELLGQNVFNVYANGLRVLNNIDITAGVGGCTVNQPCNTNSAVSLSFGPVAVPGNTLTITLAQVTGNVTLSSVSVLASIAGPLNATSLITGTTGVAGCITFYDTFGTATILCSPSTANGILTINGAGIGSSLGLGSIFVSAGGVITPAVDSTTAIRVNNANGSNNILDFDTTNGRIGIGTTTPGVLLEVNGTEQIDGAFVSNSAVTTLPGTGGTANCYAPIWGPTFKLATCTLVSYSETGTAQTYTFPTSPGAFTTQPLYLQFAGASQTSCGTYNASATTTVLTLPANAAMTAQSCTILVMGR